MVTEPSSKVCIFLIGKLGILHTVYIYNHKLRPIGFFVGTVPTRTSKENFALTEDRNMRISVIKVYAEMCITCIMCIVQ